MSKNLNYEVTLKEAERRFCERNLKLIPQLSGASLGVDGILQVNFINSIYQVDPTGRVWSKEHKDEVLLTTKILILHYLAQSSGIPAQNKLISFKELPGGAIYIQPFTNRAIRPLVSLFGHRPEGLLEAAVSLGATKSDLGDVSVTVKAFPMVPVTFVLWGGDEEFPPSGNILFDQSAAEYLPTEDYAVLASLLVAELRKHKSQDN